MADLTEGARENVGLLMRSAFLRGRMVLVAIALLALLARAQGVAVGWTSVSAMPIAPLYGAQIASATGDGSRIYAAAAWESQNETAVPKYETYMKYTLLTDTWATGAFGFLSAS
jgi:hypothetical protein